MEGIEVRVCLTNECNFSCRYCCPGGEGVSNNHPALEMEEMYKIIEKLSTLGIKVLRFTGGEPLLRKDIFEIADYLSTIPNITYYTLVTNGSLLTDEVALKLKHSNTIKSVTISLDSLKPDLFSYIVGVDRLDDLISGVDTLIKHGIKTRINTVVSKDNFDELGEIINFCKQRGITLKLLDLVDNQFNEWQEKFIPLFEVEKVLKLEADEMYVSYPQGGLGTPMNVYRLGSTEVMIKDNTIGTCYCDFCNDCNKYPCQAGVVSLILTHDGKLKLCTLSDDFNLDLKPLLKDDPETYEILKNFIAIYKNSSFQNKWYLSTYAGGLA